MVGDVAYAYCPEDDLLLAFDLDRMERIWSRPSWKKRDWELGRGTRALTHADGLLLFGAEGGWVFAVDPGDGEIRHRADLLGHATRSSPLLHDDVFIVWDSVVIQAIPAYRTWLEQLLEWLQPGG